MDEEKTSDNIEMSNQICLKWNSFLNNIATSFESLWEEEGLVDVTLASDGQCLTAHKVILSASSPFFKKVFQTNPCQHPVIILQDVHFSELEALLIFIYKGEVNIEQKNLPALLKAAETLQIRGLSGGDIFARESYKRLLEVEKASNENDDKVDENEEVNKLSTSVENPETQKKRRKISKSGNNSILEKALTPGLSRPESACESTTSEISRKDEEVSNPEPDEVLNPVYHRLEMKIEPYELTVEELQKQDIKEELERLDTGQETQVAGTSRATLTVIPEARSIRERSTNQEAAPDREGIVLRTDKERISHLDDEDHRETLNLSTGSSSINDEHSQNNSVTKGTIVYPPFPCPFCDRAYTSWGFRRRHIKAVHTISPRLNCKWCLQVLPTHAAWRRHVISAHNLSASDAHNGLLILEEAHMVLQIAHPTRLNMLVDIIKQNSQQSGDGPRDNEPDPN